MNVRLVSVDPSVGSKDSMPNGLYWIVESGQNILL